MTSLATYVGLIYGTKQAIVLSDNIIRSISGGSPELSAISGLHWTLFGPKLKLLNSTMRP